MEVGIIGAGELAAALARLMLRSGIDVVAAGVELKAQSRPPLDKLRGRVRLATILEAAQPELVILALPWDVIAETVRPIVDWGARAVVDASNHFGRPASAIASTIELAEKLPDARVVKAFNALPAEVLDGEPPDAGQAVMFYSGDHERPKTFVARLIEQVDYCPIDLGGLSHSAGLLEPGGALFGQRLIRLP